VTTSGGVEVYVDANGQLGTLTSSRRFKHDIKAMGNVSEKLMQLRPVQFRYTDAAEKGPHAVQYGLIAEEVAKVYPNLVQYDKAGKPFTVYYHLLTPMLLNELQKEHHRAEEQRTQIQGQKTEIIALKAALQQQSAELASLRQTQEQQVKVLAKLAAFVQTAQIGTSLQPAHVARR
jgi:alpha-mannosidase